MEGFDFYKVLIVDKYGSQKGDKTWNVPVKKAVASEVESKCCKDDTYSTTVSGMWPKSCATGCKFMVTPYQSKKGDLMEFVLPLGVMTADFADASDGAQITVQSASFEMTVSDPKFLKSAHFESTMRTSIADTIPDIDESMITNIVGTLVAAGNATASNRRLAGSKVKVSFDVLLPAAYAGKPFKAESIDTTKLAANIVKTAKAQGITLVVAVEKVVVSEAVQAGTPAVDVNTDGASAMGGLSGILVALMTLTGRHLLA